MHRMKWVVTAICGFMATYAFADIYDEFDASSSVDLRGTVLEVRWVEPNVEIDVEVDGSSGKQVWTLVGDPPNILTAKALSEATFKIGDDVEFQGYETKNSSCTSGCRVLAVSVYVIDANVEDGFVGRFVPFFFDLTGTFGSVGGVPFQPTPSAAFQSSSNSLQLLIVVGADLYNVRADLISSSPAIVFGLTEAELQTEAVYTKPIPNIPFAALNGSTVYAPLVWVDGAYYRDGFFTLLDEVTETALPYTLTLTDINEL